jgi:predicted phosphoribosyltransferase
VDDDRMSAHFQDRADAGRQLVAKLGKYHEAPGGLVVALPRGGVPVAREVARGLGLPLEILVVRKLGVPGNEEYAMGAIASGGIRILNAHAVSLLRIGPETIDAVAFREGRELERREKVFRQGRPARDVRGKTVVLVDDGVATGSTLRAAIQCLRRRGARRIVAAIPTIAQDTLARLRSDADEWVVLIAPPNFRSVGEWYASFPQVADAEVAGILAQETANPEDPARGMVSPDGAARMP